VGSAVSPDRVLPGEVRRLRQYVPPPPPWRRHVLVVEYVGQRFSRDEFNLLLGYNGVVPGEGNFELVAKAFVLISLPDYLEEEIVFSDWQEGSWPSRIRRPYNYSITSWTRIQGIRIQWYFLFDEEGLHGAGAGAIEHNVGDYIDVPFEELSPPYYTELEYWR
jgi:hypothetical protein